MIFAPLCFAVWTFLMTIQLPRTKYGTSHSMSAVGGFGFEPMYALLFGVSVVFLIIGIAVKINLNEKFNAARKAEKEEDDEEA
jgi:hypothetical protein